MTTETKICIACGVEKPLSEFHPSWKSRDGRQHRCPTCSLAHMRKRREPTVPIYPKPERVLPSREDLATAREAGIPLALWGILE